MAPSPVPVLATVILYAVVFGLVQGEEEDEIETYGLDTAPEIEAPEGGLFDSISAVFDTIGGVFAMVLGALFFNVDGAPWWVRVPISALVIGSLSWSLVTLARGN